MGEIINRWKELMVGDVPPYDNIIIPVTHSLG